MNTVCEVCGDVGYRQLLIYCRDCKRCAVHQYCLDKVVFDASLIKWFCYECLQRRGKATCISSLEVSSERPLSDDGSRSAIHQLITNSVGSVRDSGPWRNGINESSATKYTSLNRIYSLVKKHTKKKSLMKPMGNCTNRKLRIAKVTTHTSPEASRSCETIGTESAKSNHSRNQQVDHENPVASVQEISVDHISISSSSHDTIEASESSEGFTECQKATSCRRRKTVKMAMVSSPSAESGEDAMSENASLEYVLACREDNLLCGAASPSRSETGFQSAGPCPGGGSSPKTASEVHTKEPTDGAYFIDMNGILHESLESKDTGSPSHPLYLLPSSSGLSKSQKKIVEERVQAIKSEVPIYVAIMKRISLGMSRMSWVPKLELSSRYATAVNLPTGEQTVVLCCGRNIWKANIVTHRRRYYLSGGWHRFVRDNGLDLGDICLFELKRNERELTMMVHIIPSK